MLVYAIGENVASKRFIMNAGRTSKQGRQFNVDKDNVEYETMVSRLIVIPEDSAELAAQPGGKLLVRS